MNPLLRNLALLIPLLLAACGFEPLYGDRVGEAPTRLELAAVEVGPIPERLGQQVRNALVDRLNPGGGEAPRYRLEMRLRKTSDTFGFRSDESVSRASLRLDADFRLMDLASGEFIHQDSARSTATYDVVQSDFATVSAERDAERRTSEQLADIVTARLGVFFRERAAEAQE